MIAKNVVMTRKEEDSQGRSPQNSQEKRVGNRKQKVRDLQTEAFTVTQDVIILKDSSQEGL